jgi:hypothetical protein
MRAAVLAASRVLAFAGLVALTCGPTASALGAGSSNLSLDVNRLKASIRFERVRFRRDDCAVTEGCTVAGRRRLLRFDTVVKNHGPEDFDLQSITGPVPAPFAGNEWYDWGGCHGHHHLKGFTSYQLLDASGTQVVMGRKQAFCLMDSARFQGDLPGKFDCDHQGITAGWQDDYPSYLDCQWLDVTDVRPGSYILRVVIDATDMVPGNDPTDDVAEIPVRIK